MKTKLTTHIALLLPVLCSLLIIGCHDKQPTTTQDTLFAASMQPGTVDEAAALTIAKRAVAANDKRAESVIYETRPEDKGWWVLARLERIDSTGQSQSTGGSNRSIHIDDRGAVTAYSRGK